MEKLHRVPRPKPRASCASIAVRNSALALGLLALSISAPGCAADIGAADQPEQGETYAPSGASTKQLIRRMANRGKVFVFDKDKTLLGGDTDKTKALLRLIRDHGADMAVLTSNTKRVNGEWKAIGQLQRKFGENLFPDSFFRTPAFQVNDKVGDRTKADEMRKIINHFGVRNRDVVFYDDKQSNIADVGAAHPGIVGVRVDPNHSMTESDLRQGMLLCLGLEDERSCAGQCSASCPCAEGEGDCDRDSDCQSGLVCPPNRPGAEQCEKADVEPPTGRVASNLQVEIDGTWRGVCSRDGDLVISDRDCSWEEHGRYLETRDVATGRATELDCPENRQRPTDCECNSTGERMHGIADGDDRHVENSLMLPNGAPIYPNSGHQTCIDLTGGALQSRFTTNSCPDWRLRDFY